ncbi:RsfA family transcriptional regulator [Paenibacillus sp. S-38]|uniref:RsfA family transcriptional regulator n=1 Tax=Paenibacillus sp. S-38 TaxID=3416710 RepID=UPI003CEEA1DB
MNERKDCWKPQEDRLLAEVILEHIRCGSTQLAAFEEVGEKLARTAAACGFRWNAVVRHSCLAAIKKAKLDRKAMKQAKHPRPIRLERSMAGGWSLERADTVIDQIRGSLVRSEELAVRVKHLEEELEAKNRRIHELEEQLLLTGSISSSDSSLSEDFKKMLKLLDRARLSGLLTDNFEQSQIS